MDNGGSTALSRVMENGHEVLVRLLAPVASEHFHGSLSQPLFRAADCGDEATARLLLEQDGANLNMKSSTGQTPLSWAARNGHDAIVQLLLERDGIDLESKCMYGRTPLS